VVIEGMGVDVKNQVTGAQSEGMGRRGDVSMSTLVVWLWLLVKRSDDAWLASAARVGTVQGLADRHANLQVHHGSMERGILRFGVTRLMTHEIFTKQQLASSCVGSAVQIRAW
jgi:hypothetical protein